MRTLRPLPQLAEDNVTNQRIVCAILKKHVRAPLVVAANGLEAVQAVKEQEFDVVLMDVQARSARTSSQDDASLFLTQPR